MRWPPSRSGFGCSRMSSRSPRSMWKATPSNPNAALRPELRVLRVVPVEVLHCHQRSIRDYVLVSVSCGESPPVTLAPAPSVHNGEFSFTGEDEVAISGRLVSPVSAVGTIDVPPYRANDGGPTRPARLRVLSTVSTAMIVSHFGRSITTMSELSRIRSNTIAFPSGVMSNACIRPRSLKRVSG